MTDESGLVDVQLVHHLRDIARLRLLVVAALGVRRQAHTAEIGNDHGVVVDEHGCNRRPHVAGIAEPVQHHDRRTFAADPDVDRRTIRRDVLGAKAAWKGLNFSGSRKRRSQHCERTACSDRFGAKISHAWLQVPFKSGATRSQYSGKMTGLAAP